MTEVSAAFFVSIWNTSPFPFQPLVGARFAFARQLDQILRLETSSQQRQVWSRPGHPLTSSRVCGAGFPEHESCLPLSSEHFPFVPVLLRACARLNWSPPPPWAAAVPPSRARRGSSALLLVTALHEALCVGSPSRPPRLPQACGCPKYSSSWGLGRRQPQGMAQTGRVG